MFSILEIIRVGKEPERTRTIIETQRLSVFEDTFVAEQNSLTRLRVVHPGAVVILALNEENEIVLLEQYRHAVGQRILELPAGTLEPGEQPLDCAKRELLEETGYTAEVWQELGSLLAAPGFCSEVQYLFFATQLHASQAQPEPFEDLFKVCVSIQELGNLLKSLKILDSKTIAACYRAQLLGLLDNK